MDALLQVDALNLDVQSNRGMSALASAAQHGHADVARALIAANATLDATNHDGRTALMMAAWGGHAAVVAMLLEAGADARLRDRGCAHWHRGGRRNYKGPQTALQWGRSAGPHAADCVALLAAASSGGCLDPTSIIGR